MHTVCSSCASLFAQTSCWIQFESFLWARIRSSNWRRRCCWSFTWHRSWTRLADNDHKGIQNKIASAQVIKVESHFKLAAFRYSNWNLNEACCISSCRRICWSTVHKHFPACCLFKVCKEESKSNNVANFIKRLQSTAHKHRRKPRWTWLVNGDLDNLQGQSTETVIQSNRNCFSLAEQIRDWNVDGNGVSRHPSEAEDHFTVHRDCTVVSSLTTIIFQREVESNHVTNFKHRCRLRDSVPSRTISPADQ
mmetsp:Transcript_6824/g.12215  ORF Transcript_6824/g.12215 Transcript_6824/m.12215 type:complete len:250 (-) Transcript_6824:1020-1769(-)